VPRLTRRLAPLLLAAACGCLNSGPHFVERTDGGGVVAIPNNSDVWPTHYRSRAEKLMAEYCPDGYVITGEGVVTRPRPEYGGRNDNPRFEYNGALEQLPEHKDYQISFRCRNAPPPRIGPEEVPPPPE
jgi:hypothetical protein